ncbi:ABC transporter substrate-binding protein [Desulfogranum mediterraneum]|uniref:ABC transporter substrate-binding protein n=1 Tax=Desulfogranum mediterraneum TaxID=160661 RepID=UPI0004194A90|nr:transporter substrate-binding domain-containing protein [Desulfogranum mediterraneum]
MNRWSPVLLIPLLSLLLCSCAGHGDGSSGKPPAQTQLLRVGVSANAPPMVYRGPDGLIGLEIAFARGLADYSGRRLKLVRLPWEEQIPALVAGKTDIIMSAMTITPARSYRLSFVQPYMATSQIALVRGPDYNRYSDGFPALLNPGVRVGTVSGTSGDLFVAQNKARGVRTTFSRSEQAVRALLAKEIDALVYDLPGSLYYASLYADQGLVAVIQPMTREQLAWAVGSDQQQLLEQANRYLSSIKADGRLRQLIEQWIPFYRQLYNNQP